MLWNIKDTKKETSVLDDIFYLENRAVKCEELEVTEEIKLGYGVTAGKSVNRTTNIPQLKARFETASIDMDI